MSCLPVLFLPGFANKQDRSSCLFYASTLHVTLKGVAFHNPHVHAFALLFWIKMVVNKTLCAPLDEPVASLAWKSIRVVGAITVGFVCVVLVGLASSPFHGDTHPNAAFSTAALPITASRAMPVSAETWRAAIKPTSVPLYFQRPGSYNVVKPHFKDSGAVAIHVSAGKGMQVASDNCCPPNTEKRMLLDYLLLGSAGAVALSPWTETDFRAGEAPWWKP